MLKAKKPICSSTVRGFGQVNQRRLRKNVHRCCCVVTGEVEVRLPKPQTRGNENICSVNSTLLEHCYFQTRCVGSKWGFSDGRNFLLGMNGGFVVAISTEMRLSEK